ncbi:MAG TPA: type II secretion system F family protein, partial [Actinomycetota bacterium]|nr:type II secretion system F family protein [Actinomycetota bacterium]
MAQERILTLAPKADRGPKLVRTRGRKVPLQEVMHFSRQLAAFMRAGIPIIDALEVMSEESPKALREMLTAAIEDLKAGESLSDALAHHPKALPAYYPKILRSAEMTGRLDSVLDEVAGYLEREIEARRAIRSAMIYPSAILGMAGVAVVVLTGFVLPRFERFFVSFNAKLPLPTRILLGIAGFMGRWWWLIVAGLVVTVVGLVLISRTTRGRAARDRVLLRLPAIGDVVRFAVIERVARILASTIRAGVPLPEAMSVTAEGAHNVVYQRALGEVREAMMRGEGIARPLADTKLFPTSVLQMVKVGEHT